jgi:predicted nucleic acid-binding protein
MAKTLVVDANILIRAVLGEKVITLLRRHVQTTYFVTVTEAFEDAEQHIPGIIRRSGGNEEEVATALQKLTALHEYVQTVSVTVLAHLELVARKRLQGRDEEDWLYLALALLLKCPIWTEDTDFFGCGVAVWTSDRINLFLEEDDSLGL